MPEKVQLYGTNWCPHTSRSRRIMDEHRVDYAWRDIEKDKEACAFVEKTNRGNRSVPTIVFPDGTVMVEPADGELVEKCRNLKIKG
jgi:mycoredoxin